jgi:hypothetical protein
MDGLADYDYCVDSGFFSTDLPQARLPQVLANTGNARTHGDFHRNYGDLGVSLFAWPFNYSFTSANEYYVTT